MKKVAVALSLGFLAVSLSGAQAGPFSKAREKQAEEKAKAREEKAKEKENQPAPVSQPAPQPERPRRDNNDGRGRNQDNDNDGKRDRDGKRDHDGKRDRDRDRDRSHTVIIERPVYIPVPTYYPPDPYEAQARREDALLEAVAKQMRFALRENPILKPFNLDTDTVGDSVEIEGQVNTFAQMQLALDVARNIDPRTRIVITRIKVRQR